MALFGGATTNTSGSNSSTSTSLGTNTSSTSTTPNIPQWYSTFLGSIPGQFQGLSAGLNQRAQQPLYGDRQQATFQTGLNQSQGALQQQLNSLLASQGALNSGRAAQMDTQLALGGQKQLADYLTQVPQLNAQNQQVNTSQLLQLLGQQTGFTSPISAFGTTQTGSSSAGNSVVNTGTNTGVGQINPNILGALAGGGIDAILQAIIQGNNGGNVDWNTIFNQLGLVFNGQ